MTTRPRLPLPGLPVLFPEPNRTSPIARIVGFRFTADGRTPTLRSMAIHTVDKDSSAELGADIYAAELACGSLPKRPMPESGVPGAVAYALVRDELILDGNARQNLATFCTTWMEPEVHQLMSDSVDKNMIDKDEYPRRRKSSRAAFTSTATSRCCSRRLGGECAGG